MVEKKSAISYESIMKDLKARKYSPVYVLMGEEPFYIDKICDYISENVLQPEERDFNSIRRWFSELMLRVRKWQICARATR